MEFNSGTEPGPTSILCKFLADHVVRLKGLNKKANRDPREPGEALGDTRECAGVFNACASQGRKLQPYWPKTSGDRAASSRANRIKGTESINPQP